MTSTTIATSLFLVFVSFLAWLIRRQRVAAGRERFAEMDAGEVCFHCESSQIRSTTEGLRCAACGMVTPRALLERSEPLEPQLLERIIVDPRDSRPWYAR